MRVVLAQGACKSFKPVTTFLELCVSSLCQGHADLHIKKKKLELCVSSLCQGHANTLQISGHVSRIVRVLLVQGPRLSFLYLLGRRET